MYPYYWQEDPTEKSGEREDTSDREREEVEEEGGEEAVDMTQEFEGDVKDLPEKEEEEEGSGGQSSHHDSSCIFVTLS